MRLITRGDADGLACAVFVTIMEKIDSIIFAHPKDMQDGIVDVRKGDIICNLPYYRVGTEPRFLPTDIFDWMQQISN